MAHWLLPNETVKVDAPRVSAIICTYNGRARIRPVLEHLAGQVGIERRELEIILVDNASTDETADEARTIWCALGDCFDLKVIKEAKPGLTHARRAGVNAASGEIIVLTDDDNWLAPDYVSLALARMSSDRSIAALGGKIEAAFEDQYKPNWFDEYSQAFAVGRQANLSGDVTDSSGIVWGAGLVLRRSALVALWEKGFEQFLSDRKGNTLSSGGDSELCLALRLCGWKIHYDSRLTLTHWMPRARMEISYLRRLFRAIGSSEVYLREYRRGFASDPSVRKGRILRCIYQREAYNRAVMVVKTIGRYICARGVHQRFRESLNFQYQIGALLELLRCKSRFDHMLDERYHAHWWRHPTEPKFNSCLSNTEDAA